MSARRPFPLTPALFRGRGEGGVSARRLFPLSPALFRGRGEGGVRGLPLCARAATILVVAISLLPACAPSPPPRPLSEAHPTPAASASHTSPLDWTLGHWRGFRRDGADSSTAPITVHVEPILAGAGQIEHLEARHTPAPGVSDSRASASESIYRGFSIQSFNPDLNRWVRYYTNSSRPGRFTPIEGQLDSPDGARSTWRNTAPDRTRESKMVSVRTAPNHWTRTMWISEDHGATWRILWEDNLTRQ